MKKFDQASRSFYMEFSQLYIDKYWISFSRYNKAKLHKAFSLLPYQ